MCLFCSKFIRFLAGINLFLLFTACANAENLLGDNKFLARSDWAVYIAGQLRKAGATVKFLNGKVVINTPSQEKQHWAKIQLVKKVELPPEKNYRLMFDVKSNKPAQIYLVYGMKKTPYSAYSKPVTMKIESGQKEYVYTFRTRKGRDGNYNSPRAVRFGLGALSGVQLSICNIRLEEVTSLLPEKSWTAFIHAVPPRNFHTIPHSLKSANNGSASSRTITLNNNTIDLAGVSDSFSSKDRAVLYNEFYSPKNGYMRLGVSADWWMEVYVNGQKQYSTILEGNETGRFSPNDHIFDFPVKKGKNLLAVKVLAGSKGWKFVCGTPTGQPTERKPTVKFVVDSEWKVVDMSDLRVKKGSPLDLSKISAISRKTPRTLSRLVIGANGRLEAENVPGVPVRLNGYSFSSTSLLLKKYSKEYVNEILELSRVQGYNLLRMAVELICPKKNLLIDPESIDKIDYLLSRMKHNGIYMYLNLYAYHLYHKRKEWGPIWKLIYDNKIRMFLGDPVLRGEFKEIVGKLMNHVNPYTGIAWKDDPVFACMELYNEQSLALMFMHRALLRPETKQEFNRQFRQWLQEKYETPEKLSKAWDSADIKSFEDVKRPQRFLASAERPQDRDFTLFINSLIQENTKWMKKTLRQCGYQGLVSHYNLPKWIGSLAARFENSQVAICNSYFKHPSNQTKRGSKCSQDSSVFTEGYYICNANATRFADRPFMITEINHPFWNKYQHEGGLVYGTYSAFQGFDARIAHAMPVILDKNFSVGPYKDSCSAFSIGNNPVARANEFLSACLYMRGDVKTSGKRIQLNIPESEMSNNKPVWSMQSKISLLTGFSINFPWAKPAEGVGVPSEPDMIIFPPGNNRDQVKSGNWSTEIKASADSKSYLNKLVAGMKSKGILPRSNISNPARGIYQSDTGEITMRAKENLLKVCTPLTEAVTLKAGAGEVIGTFRVIKSDIPAMVAVISMDGRNIYRSRRMVMIYSTEAANSGMTLSHDRVTMISLGKRPALMRVGNLSAALKNESAKKVSMYALGFDGSRREKIPLESSGNTVGIKLSTGRLKQGPTPFFELVCE